MVTKRTCFQYIDIATSFHVLQARQFERSNPLFHFGCTANTKNRVITRGRG